jgi:uncharacterized membrane protein/protein-disulfide isomerase
MPSRRGASLVAFLGGSPPRLTTPLACRYKSDPVTRHTATLPPTVPGLSSRAWIVLLLAALVGLAASASATWVHYRLLSEPGYSSFCDFGTTFNCSQVYLSRFGVVRGMPIAIAGSIWFGFVLLLTLWGRRGPAHFREGAASYLFVLATVGLAVILYLGYASFFVLRAVCILCLTTYAAVIGVFVVSGAASSVPMKTLPRRLLVDLRAIVTSPIALLAALVFLAGAASVVAWFPREAALAVASPGSVAARDTGQAAPPAQVQPSASQQSEFERWYGSQPRVNLPVSADGARVLIVKFNDYQCPACGQSYEWYKPILAKYQAERPGQVRFVSMDFPLHPACNAAVTRAVHLASCEAAVAVRLAREHGKAEAMEQWLYTNQSATPELIKTAARDVGGVADFDARFAGLLQLVKTDAALGGLNSVRSTPTFFINGTLVVGALPPQFFDAAIALELKKAQ